MLDFGSHVEHVKGKNSYGVVRHCLNCMTHGEVISLLLALVDEPIIKSLSMYIQPTSYPSTLVDILADEILPFSDIDG